MLEMYNRLSQVCKMKSGLLFNSCNQVYIVNQFIEQVHSILTTKALMLAKLFLPTMAWTLSSKEGFLILIRLPSV